VTRKIATGFLPTPRYRIGTRPLRTPAAVPRARMQRAHASEMELASPPTWKCPGTWRLELAAADVRKRTDRARRAVTFEARRRATSRRGGVPARVARCLVWTLRPPAARWGRGVGVFLAGIHGARRAVMSSQHHYVRPSALGLPRNDLLHDDGEITSPSPLLQIPGDADARERMIRGTHGRPLLFHAASRKGEEEKMSCHR
jgi:hypothetical protein